MKYPIVQATAAISWPSRLILPQAGRMALLSTSLGILFLLVSASSEGPVRAAYSSHNSMSREKILNKAFDRSAASGRPYAASAAAPFVIMATSPMEVSKAQKCLADAIYYEAGSETIAGQRAVAQVVVNRVRHKAFPNSVCGVVYQGANRPTGCQFTFTCDGSLDRAPSLVGWRQASAVAKEALNGFVFHQLGYATHYHASWMTPYWASSVRKVGNVGGHVFYRFQGAGGRSTAFTQPYRGFEVTPSFGTRTKRELATALATVNEVRTVPRDGEGQVDALADPQNADLLQFQGIRERSTRAAGDEKLVLDSLSSALR